MLREILFLRGINLHKFSLTWPGILVFFQFEKGREKTQNKKKQVRFHSPSTCLISRRENVFTLNFTAWKSSLIFRNMISFTPRVKNSRMEWMGEEFEIHAPWPWKKFTVFSEIHKPPFRMKGHIWALIYEHVGWKI